MILRTSTAASAVAASCLVLLTGDHLFGQAFSIQNFTSRPFVTGVTPVIGPNGGVGGVAVDAKGVISRITPANEKNLRALWLRAHQPIAGDLTQKSSMRMVSLAGLDRELAKLIDQKKQPTEAMYYLAGLQRVRYVFVVPERNDVVLAGPAAGWQANESGDVVSTDSGLPVLQLQDLIDALRTEQSVRQTGITCSIEPTEEGLKRYAQLKSRRLTFNRATVTAMEKAIGPQQILLSGIARDSRFARIMVAADYRMKRLAMGFERSPVKGLPNYLDMLRRNPGTARISSPRWWMTTDYQPLAHSADRLAWRIEGAGVKTLTEDSLLNAHGQRVQPADPNALAQRWADTMTEKYPQLSLAAPIFGQLRNCIDLSVVAALIANEGMLTVADCRLNVLLDETKLKTPPHAVPESVPSQASMVKGQNGWIVSVSGGVEIDAFGVVENVEPDAKIGETYKEAISHAPPDRWWW